MKHKKISVKDFKKMVNEELDTNMNIKEPTVNAEDTTDMVDSIIDENDTYIQEKNCGNILILNGCTESDSVEKFKQALTCDADEVKLYQLNIQAPSRNEIKDGMEMISSKIEQASAIVIACDVDKKKLPSNISNVLKRLSSMYETLEDKVFGTLITGATEDIKTELKMFALDMGMIISGGCLKLTDEDSVEKVATCISKLSAISYSIGSEPKLKDETEKDIFEPSITGVEEFGYDEDIDSELESENDEYETESENYGEEAFINSDEEETDDEDEDVDNEEVSESFDTIDRPVLGRTKYADSVEEEDVIPYDIPVWAVKYLTKGEDFDLDEEDVQMIEDFKERVISDKGNAVFNMGGDESLDPVIKSYNDIEGDIKGETVILYIQPTEIYENIKLNVKPFEQWLK